MAGFDHRLNHREPSGSSSRFHSSPPLDASSSSVIQGKRHDSQVWYQPAPDCQKPTNSEPQSSLPSGSQLWRAGSGSWRSKSIGQCPTAQSSNQQAKSQIAPTVIGAQQQRAQKSTNWRTGPPPSPGGRKRAASTRSLLPSEAFAGLITMIPHWNQIAALSSSVVHSQSHVNAGAASHPAIILQLRDSGRIALVGQMTSWTRPSAGRNGAKHHMTVMEKFPKHQVLRAQHLAIAHKGTTVPHDSLPVLELANGKNMHHQTSIKLDHFFEIETSLLERLDNNQSYLTPDSFCRLAKHFHDFVVGVTPRLGMAPNRPVSPLDLTGAPALSADTMACVAWGEQLEIARLQAFLASYQPPQSYSYHECWSPRAVRAC